MEALFGARRARDLEDNPFAKERLLAEVRSARTVSHPNVCRVYDVGEVHGHVFLTMEYIDGEDLASLLRRIGRLPPAKALEVARQLCAGLAAAHERGVLHRDLKPANVMIDGRGQARITDFGLAVEVEQAGARVWQGAGGQAVDVAGTIAYLAPERFEGRPATAQSDLYALGLVLYEVYTGKPAVSASTIEGWRRAHGASTPSHPSAIVSEIEPAVERAILRCLEKDPAKRPGSAAQLAASLPGGDPLAAAVAAGETPSPELVAASGGEGVLSRARAWLWFGACLAALALSVLWGSQGGLANLLSLNEPSTQRTAARRMLASFGYREAPRDWVSRYYASPRHLRRFMEARPSNRWFTDLDVAGSPAIYFAYRESPGPLFSWMPFPSVDVESPEPNDPADLYLELDGQGRMCTFRAGGVLFRRSEPLSSHPMDWTVLFAAAGLDQSSLSEVPAAWAPTFTADESRAWEGRVGGQAVRVEASAYRGRAVQFLLNPVAAPSPGRVPVTAVEAVVNVMPAVTIYAALAALALFARHNLRLGRGDRRGAFRLALAVLGLEAVYWLSSRHLTFEPLNLTRSLVFLTGPPLFATAFTWLAYIGMEPFLRRRWPNLLIPWARLLEGRWRDPMIGRSVLAGTLTALVLVGTAPGLLALLTRRYSLPLAVPWFTSGTLDAGPLWFLGSTTAGWVAPVHAFMLVGSLLGARLVLRHDTLAWLTVLLAAFAVHRWDVSFPMPWLNGAPGAAALMAGLVAAGFVTATARWGLLAGVTFYAVWIAVSKTPLTMDPTRWYAWRTGVLVLLIGALALWGFHNVLGRQSAFPAGALEE